MLDELDYPMFIATVPGDGCLIGFATQCSIDPLRFLVCVSNKNKTYRLARDATHMALHVVPEDREDLAELFGGETADESDKLARVEWRPGPGGAPIVAGLESWFAGRVVQRIDYDGDHTGFVLSPVAAQADGDGDELSFQEAKDIEPGHAP